jgi:3D (Asp-Asp-Asp) domain-containing protein
MKIFSCILLFFLALVCSSCARDEMTMEVVGTAYNALPGQTQGDPEIGAWGDKLDVNIPSIAVSRDLIELGLVHNAKVRVDGFSGYYLVRDKLNKRFTKQIDIFMGLDRDAAIEFGKKTVRIYWTPAPVEK